jgi:hypothetical protein
MYRQIKNSRLVVQVVYFPGLVLSVATFLQNLRVWGQGRILWGGLQVVRSLM